MLSCKEPMKTFINLPRQLLGQQTGIIRSFGATEPALLRPARFDFDHGGVLGIGICRISLGRQASFHGLGRDLQGTGILITVESSAQSRNDVGLQVSAWTSAQLDGTAGCGALTEASDSLDALFGSQLSRLRFPGCDQEDVLLPFFSTVRLTFLNRVVRGLHVPGHAGDTGLNFAL